MTRTGTLASLASLLLAACTPMQWVKQEATPQQARHDAVSCQQEAWHEVRARSWYYRPMAPYLVRDASGRHFFAWPNGPFADPFGDPFLDESRLAQFCMRSKGYQLVPVEKPAKG